MPLTCEEEFVGRLQKGNRVQIPVLIRWKNKLKPGEVLRVCIYVEGVEECFYVRLGAGGRFTIPEVIRARIAVRPGDILEVTLLPVQ